MDAKFHRNSSSYFSRFNIVL